MKLGACLPDHRTNRPNRTNRTKWTNRTNQTKWTKRQYRLIWVRLGCSCSSRSSGCGSSSSDCSSRIMLMNIGSYIYFNVLVSQVAILATFRSKMTILTTCEVLRPKAQFISIRAAKSLGLICHMSYLCLFHYLSFSSGHFLVEKWPPGHLG